MRMTAVSGSRSRFLIVSVVLCGALAAPPSLQAKVAVYRLYEGAQRPAAEIAVLRGDGSSPNILSIDRHKPPGGKGYYKGSGWSRKFSIELLPGPHVLEVQVIQPVLLQRSGLVVSLQLTAEAGHEYAIQGGEIISGGEIPVVGAYRSPTVYTGKWQASIIDLTAGVTVRKWSTEHPEGQDWQEVVREAQASAGELERKFERERAQIAEEASSFREIAEGGPCPYNAMDLKAPNGVLTCQCSSERTQPGGFWGAGGVWGTDVYYSESLICRAALHAGVIGPEGGIVTIRTLAGRKSYAGNTRNGVTTMSESVGVYRSSYRFEASPPAKQP